jgi:hypothetical protein
VAVTLFGSGLAAIYPSLRTVPMSGATSRTLQTDQGKQELINWSTIEPGRSEHLAANRQRLVGRFRRMSSRPTHSLFFHSVCQKLWRPQSAWESVCMHEFGDCAIISLYRCCKFERTI